MLPANRFIEVYEESKLSSMIPLFLAHVIQFIREAERAALQEQTETKEPSASEELIASLRQTCAQLVQIVTFVNPLYVEPCLQMPPTPVNWSEARQITAKLGHVFVSIVDTFVGREIQVGFLLT